MQTRHDRRRKQGLRRHSHQQRPIGSLYRIGEVAKLAHHSHDWVDRIARLPNSPLVAVRVPGSKRIVGFTEASVRAFLNGETATKEVRQ